MIINLLHPPQTTAWPDKVQSLYEWNDLEGQPVHNSTKMHELNLTKESSLPPPLFSFFLHPSIPLVSSLEPSHAPAVLWSSAAVFGKINWAAGEMTSSELRGGSVSVSAAASWPFCSSRRESVISTHVHTLCSTETVHESVCDIPGNSKNVEGQCKDSGRSTCLSGHISLHMCQPHTNMPTYMICPHRYTVVLHMTSYTLTHRQTLKSEKVSVMAVWVSYGRKLMLYSPTGSAERNRAERRAQLPAVPKSHLTTTHLNKQQSKTLSTPNRDRAH